VCPRYLGGQGRGGFQIYVFIDISGEVRVKKREFLPSCVLSSSGAGVTEGETTLGPAFPLDVAPTSFPSSSEEEAGCCEL